ncbi:MAG: hypothetical protein WBN40_12115 [Pseudomonadales bacterium]
MAFHEKSAWIMLIALLITGLLYFSTVLSMSQALGDIAPPNIPILVVFTVALTLFAIVGHIVVAALSAREANRTLDERERKIGDRAGNFSSYLFGLGIVLALGIYLFSRNGDLIFYAVFGSLIIAQIFEYLLQLYFYRAKFD